MTPKRNGNNVKPRVLLVMASLNISVESSVFPSFLVTDLFLQVCGCNKHKGRRKRSNSNNDNSNNINTKHPVKADGWWNKAS